MPNRFATWNSKRHKPKIWSRRRARWLKNSKRSPRRQARTWWSSGSHVAPCQSWSVVAWRKWRKIKHMQQCHEETKKQFRTIWFRLSQYPFCLHYWAYSYTLLALPRHHSWLYLVDHENGNRLYRKLIKNTLEASLRLLNHSINGKVPWH